MTTVIIGGVEFRTTTKYRNLLLLILLVLTIFNSINLEVNLTCMIPFLISMNIIDMVRDHHDHPCCLKQRKDVAFIRLTQGFTLAGCNIPLFAVHLVVPL